MPYFKYYIGREHFIIAEKDGVITDLMCNSHIGSTETMEETETELLQNASNAVKAYYEGHGDKLFKDIPIEIEGSELHRRVIAEIMKIPYGQVKTYQEVADLLGGEVTARMVANEAKRNRIIILIPCHRLVKSGGKAGTYPTGIYTKQRLLEMETGEKYGF